jgi:hypothetical protein
MRRSTAPLMMLAPALVAFAVTACGGGGSSGTAPPTVSTSTRPLSRVDPCVVVTAAEASSLTGGSFGAGTRTAVQGRRRCVYGANSLLVFTVEVSRARSAADAEAAFAQDEARARSALTRHLPAHLAATLHVSDVSGVGDRAAIGTYSANIGGEAIGVSAIYVLDGATFLTFSDVNLGGAAPTDEAMAAQARTSLGRL